MDNVALSKLIVEILCLAVVLALFSIPVILHFVEVSVVINNLHH